MRINYAFCLLFIVFLLKYQQKQAYIIHFNHQKGNNNREAGKEKQVKNGMDKINKTSCAAHHVHLCVYMHVCVKYIILDLVVFKIIPVIKTLLKYTM